MCRVISAVLPECKLLESARPENGDTFFLPMLFKSLDAWEYGYGADPEVARNRFIFSHVMSVISFEIVGFLPNFECLAWHCSGILS